jgi:hypothetical protein
MCSSVSWPDDVQVGLDGVIKVDHDGAVMLHILK